MARNLERFFPGDSELAARMRRLDWSQTAYGSPTAWPENLRTAVRVCLTSRFPIVLWWGPDFSMLYNDAYIPFLGSQKHPRYLGQPGRDCWREIWDTIGPMLDGVSRTGKATWSDDLQFFFDRDLPREEVYVTFTYGPILAPDGRTVQGIFCPCTETTEKVVGARRLQTLRNLGVEALETHTIDAARDKAAAILAESPSDTPFAAIFSVNDAKRRADLRSSAGLSSHPGLMPSSISLSNGAGAVWPIASAIRSRRMSEVDLARAGVRVSGPEWPDVLSKAVVLPLVSSAHEPVSDVIVLGVSPRRPLDASYRAFFDLVAGQIAAVMASARAHEEQRKRADALAEIDRAKTAFFSNVSHEFRTPLTLMLGPLEDTLAQADGLSAGTRESLEIAHRNSLRLLKLVNTLLDFSRIEAGRIEASYEPTDLAALTADLASVFRSAIERAGLRLVVECPPLPEDVYVDREMWEKIVLNLLANALKFTFEGEIEVSLQKAGDRVELAVRDTGTGIAPEELPHLFERFHRVKGARARTFEGSGIGLALVQDLSKLHGGTVRVESEVDRGSRFIVSLPFGKAHLPADRIEAARELASTGVRGEAYVQEALRWIPAAGAHEGRGARAGRDVAMQAAAAGARRNGGRILVADDNADMREYVRRLLSDRYEVETVGDGVAAFEAALARPPDLAIVDVMMPGQDGFALLGALRADQRLKTVPVIMLSARAGEESRVDGMRAGADDYLVKPFSARELVTRVGAHLEIARVRRGADRGLRQSRARLQALVDASAQIIWTSDSTGTVVEDSPTWRAFTGQPFEEFKGRGWLDVLHPDDRERTAALWRQAVQDETPLQTEYRIKHVGGEWRWMTAHVVPVLNSAGAVREWIGMSTDITMRKRTEEAQREIEVQLRHATQTLEYAVHTREEFLSIASHELRNPVNALQLQLVALERGIQQSDEHVPREWIGDRVGHAVGAVRRLVRLVETLLDVSRLTAGRLDLEPEEMDFGQSVGTVVDAFRDQLKDRRVTLRVAPVIGSWDRFRLEQIVTNLVSNAIKYGEGSPIEITLDGDGDTAHLAVTDHGIGIDAENQERLFERFERAVSRRHYGGFGLGLWITRRIVDTMGGRITVESRPGEGSTFRVTLPRKRIELTTDGREVSVS
jgi:PAS domain S-box-containing protein